MLSLLAKAFSIATRTHAADRGWPSPSSEWPLPPHWYQRPDPQPHRDNP